MVAGLMGNDKSGRIADRRCTSYIDTKTTFALTTKRRATLAFGDDDRQKQDGSLFCYKWNRNLRGECFLDMNGH